MKRAMLFFALVLVCLPSVLRAQATDTLPPVLDPAQSQISPAAIGITGCNPLKSSPD